MKYITIYLTVLLFFGLISCDPVHEIRLENMTSDTIQVLTDLNGQLGLGLHKMSLIEIHGITYKKVSLDSSDYITIGNVVARYDPQPRDISIDRLEIWLKNDTIKLIGKNAIFAMLNKKGRCDWRMTIK